MKIKKNLFLIVIMISYSKTRSSTKYLIGKKDENYFSLLIFPL
jgi:hypothetical protein